MFVVVRLVYGEPRRLPAQIRAGARGMVVKFEEEALSEDAKGCNKMQRKSSCRIRQLY